jgi:hypothetical protein
MKFIRPQDDLLHDSKPFGWVHVARADGQPLCGKTYDFTYTMHIEEHENPLDLTVCLQCIGLVFGYNVIAIKTDYTDHQTKTDYEFLIEDFQGGRTRDEVLQFCQECILESVPEQEAGPDDVIFVSLDHAGAFWRYKARR